MNNIQELFKRIFIKPKNVHLYELALTHPSYNADARTKNQDYERLEYIGDAVLGFVCADLIYKLHPNLDQGIMSKLRSYLVKSSSLANYARKIELHEYIKTGHSIDSKKIAASDNILEDVFEALIGAIYLDLGINKIYSYIKSFMYNDIKNIDFDVLTDYKTKLQEAMQSEHRDSVTYVVVDEKGPPHDKTFYVDVMFGGMVLAKGVGKSKKAAEEDAAKNALAKGGI
ncbi:MAG: ribonuclease III [Bacilli bacterium]|nr:ribonuclease III [Bacilli bacterium]